jgi:hypothetical protein
MQFFFGGFLKLRMNEVWYGNEGKGDDERNQRTELHDNHPLLREFGSLRVELTSE